MIMGSLLLSSCYYGDDPLADFTASDNPVKPFEVIYFSNHSMDGNDYFWDFGDGFTSTEYNPEHYYDAEGTYTVTLTVNSYHGGSDISKMFIDVYYTDLEVTVVEWNSDFVLDNLIPNATVTLYATYDDWYNLRHPIQTGKTDNKGLAFLSDLEETGYYVDVYHPYYDNEILGQEDISYIEITPLRKAMINTFTAWVDFVPSAIQQQNRDIRIPYKSAKERRVYKTVSK